MRNNTLIPPHDAKVLERFWTKVDKSGECWTWMAQRGHYGHGIFKLDGKSVLAHRVSHELSIGPIPQGLVIDHICHNPSCVNPAHLRAVSQKQNMENRLGAHKNSKSGVRGVYWNKRSGKWEISIKHNRRRIYGGVFVNLADAERAAIALRNELFTHNDADRLAG